MPAPITKLFVVSYDVPSIFAAFRRIVRASFTPPFDSVINATVQHPVRDRLPSRDPAADVTGLSRARLRRDDVPR